MRQRHRERGLSWREKKEEEEEENCREWNRRHAQPQHGLSTHNTLSRIRSVVCVCVPARCEFHSIHTFVYIYSFFSSFLCCFLFIFRIVKQLAALLDTSRVRCFDKTWFTAPAPHLVLRQMSAWEAGLIKLTSWRCTRNTSLTEYHIYYAEHAVLTCSHLSGISTLHSTPIMAKNCWANFRWQTRLLANICKFVLGRIRISFYALISVSLYAKDNRP